MRSRQFFFAIIIVFTVSLFYKCSKPENLPPIADFSFFPASGDSSTIFTFDASGSKDDIDYLEALLVRWDANNDGIWDTELSRDKVFSHKFGKSGLVKIKMEVTDLDGLSGSVIKELDIREKNPESTIIDERDGREYKIVKIADQWWMAENLNYGTMINTSVLQTNNDTVEKYSRHNRDSLGLEYGGYYQWEEAMNYLTDTLSQSICPDGWRIPTKHDWDKLFSIYNPIVSQYFEKEGNSGLDFIGGGMLWFCLNSQYCWGNRSWTFNFIGEHINKFWTSDHIPRTTNQLTLNYYQIYKKYLCYYIDLYYVYPFKHKYSSGFSAMPVRCIKDQ